MLRGEHGTTLIELMIGLLVAAGVIGAAYAVMATSQEAATINTELVELQQNVRVAMAMMAQDIKVAGFGMQQPIANCGAPVVPADQTTGGPDTGSDAISLVVPVFISRLTAQVAPPGNVLALEAGSTADPKGQGFSAGSTVSIDGIFTASVGGINGDTVTMTTSIPATAVFPVGTPLYWLRCITYAVSTDANVCSGSPPCLVRGAVGSLFPVAQGIEDLQIAYACDGCMGGPKDGRIDDQNGNNEFDDGDFIHDTAWLAAPQTADTIRLVRLSLVARQLRPDLWWHESAPVMVEDHNPGTAPGFDQQQYKQFRRRLLTRVIHVRNAGR
jgi:type IV pilus assembly protein PilW